MKAKDVPVLIVAVAAAVVYFAAKPFPKSPLEVSPESIKDIQVWGTMLEGRLQPANPTNP